MNVATEPVEKTLLSVLEDLPPSCQMEVLEFALFIRTQNRRFTERSRYPLRGTIIRYDEPFAPVAQDRWEAAS